MTCTRHGGKDAGSIYCKFCDAEIVESVNSIANPTDMGRKMVQVPLDALDRIARDCEHGSRIWKECDALLRQYRLSEAAAPTDTVPAGETPRSDEAGRIAMAIVATGPTSLTTYAEGCKIVLEKSREIERGLADCRAEFAKLRLHHTDANEDLAGAQDRLASHTERGGAEPVAWLKEWSGGSVRVDLHADAYDWMKPCTITPLYKHPAPSPAPDSQAEDDRPDIPTLEQAREELAGISDSEWANYLEGLVQAHERRASLPSPQTGGE